MGGYRMTNSGKIHGSYSLILMTLLMISILPAPANCEESETFAQLAFNSTTLANSSIEEPTPSPNLPTSIDSIQVTEYISPSQDGEEELCPVNFTRGASYSDGIRITGAPSSLGKMTFLAQSCNLKPNNTYIGLDFQRNFYPIGSRLKILCESFVNSTYKMCMDGTHFLNEVNYTHVTAEEVSENKTIFTIDFIRPNKDYFWYFCQCKRSDDKSIPFGSMETFYVGHKPGPVTGFKCIVKDFMDTTCTWDNQTDRGVNWTVCYGAKDLWMLEEAKDYWTTDDLGPNNHFTMATMPRPATYADFTVIINGSNIFGDTTTEIDFATDQVLLSAPRIELEEPTDNTGRVNVKWHQSCSLLNNNYYQTACTVIGLKYEYNISINEAITSDLKNINHADRLMVFKDNNYKPTAAQLVEDPIPIITFPFLIPYTDYIFTMRQAVATSVHWSETSIVKFKTSGHKPFRGPFINKNAFSITGMCEGARKVAIYWKKIDIHNGGNGIIAAYSLEDKKKALLLPASSREHSTCIPFDQTTLSVYAHNRKGISPNTSITIPNENGILEDIQPCMVRVRHLKRAQIHVEEEEEYKVTVDWRLIEEHLNIRNLSNVHYTLFWCQHVNGTCQDELDWLEIVNQTQTQHQFVMKLDPLRYQYGVSVTYGGKMSGIIWAECLLGSTPPKVDGEDAAVSVFVKPANETHASVVLGLKCVDGMAMIEDINLNMCEQNALGRCSDAIITLPSITASCRKAFLIYIDTNADFRFWLTLTYLNQADELVKIETSRKGFERNEVEGANTTVVIIAIIVPTSILLIVIISIIMVYIQRKRKETRSMRVRKVEPEKLDDFIEPDTDSLSSRYSDGDNGDDNFRLDYKIPPENGFMLQIIPEPENDHLIPNQQNKEPISESSKLLQQQFSVESDVSARQRNDQSRLSLQLSEDSAYITCPDNSGGSLGYQPVHAPKSNLCDHQCKKQDYASNDVEDEDETAMTFPGEQPRISAIFRAIDSGNSKPSLHHMTLTDFTSDSAGTYKDDCKLTQLTKDRSKSRDSQLSGSDVASYLPGSSDCYLRVDGIDDFDYNSSDKGDIYLQVDRADSIMGSGSETYQPSNYKNIVELSLPHNPPDVRFPGLTSSGSIDWDGIEVSDKSVNLTSFINSSNSAI